MTIQPAIFETYEIRRVYDEETEVWWFSVVDIIQVLTQQSDYQTARKYWNKLKQRLDKEGSQSVIDCHRLKLRAADGKSYLTDVATSETLLRLVQSVPSPKANRSSCGWPRWATSARRKWPTRRCHWNRARETGRRGRRVGVLFDSARKICRSHKP